MPQPERDLWANSGSTRLDYKVENVSQPYWRHFQKPSYRPNFSNYTQVIAFGDSLLRQFAGKVPGRFPAVTRRGLKVSDTTNYAMMKFHQANIFWHSNPSMPLNTGNVQEWIDFLEQVHGETLLKSNGNVALLLGSSMWDIVEATAEQGRTFWDHSTACRLYVEQIRSLYPGVPIFWKSASAGHVHRVTPNCYGEQYCSSRLKYVSSSRTETVYLAQKKIMEEIGVPFLDLYEAYYLSADMQKDGMHYAENLGPLMLSWFYRN